MTILVAGVEDRHDVRVPEAGRRTCLAQEPPHVVRGRQALGFRDFERDVAIQLRVVGPIDCAERPLPQSLADLKTVEAGGHVSAAA